MEQPNVIITGKIPAVAIKYAKAKLNVGGIMMAKRCLNPLKLEQHFHNRQAILDSERDKLEVLEYFVHVKVLD